MATAAQIKRKADNEYLLAYPQIQAMLYAIGESEGADYGTLVFGSRKNSEISDFSTHPANKGFIRTAVINGKRISSTAAGKYQFLIGTWRELVAALGLTDFSPHSQDLAAIELLRRNGAIDHLLQNNFSGAVNAVRRVWASLPAAGYNQNENSLSTVQNYYNKGLELFNSGASFVKNNSGTSSTAIVAAALLFFS